MERRDVVWVVGASVAPTKCLGGARDDRPKVREASAGNGNNPSLRL